MSEAHLLPTAALAALEAALNRYLALDPESLERLRPLAGRVVAVEVVGAGVTLHLLPVVDGIRLYGAFDGEAEATLRGTPVALLRLGRGAAPEAAGVTMAGDTALAEAVRRTLVEAEIDWEGHLARLTGEGVAHRVGDFAREMQAWREKVATNIRRDIAAHFQEERRDLPTRPEVDAFYSEVERLRADTERLEARWERLVAGRGPGATSA